MAAIILAAIFLYNIMISNSLNDNMKQGLPICIGGKPAHAFPHFGPFAQRHMNDYGLRNHLCPSVIMKKRQNANLIGAAVIAKKAAGKL